MTMAEDGSVEAGTGGSVMVVAVDSSAGAAGADGSARAAAEHSSIRAVDNNGSIGAVYEDRMGALTSSLHDVAAFFSAALTISTP